MKATVKKCLICTLKELDAKLLSPTLSKQQHKLITRQYTLLKLKLRTKNAQNLNCCEEHKKLLAKIRQLLHKKVEKDKQQRETVFISSFEDLITLKNNLTEARRLQDRAKIDDLKIRIFQKTCEVSQRRRRWQETTLKELNLKDLTQELDELLRSNGVEKANASVILGPVQFDSTIEKDVI